VAQRSGDSRSTWEGFNVERTLTDLRGVDNFERFLSSKHFIRGPHGMFYCMISRGVETVVATGLEARHVGPTRTKERPDVSYHMFRYGPIRAIPITWVYPNPGCP
jgi:hypothetical protein